MEAPRRGRVTAITGIRDLSPASEPDVWNAIADEIHSGTTELRFGGATGADTVALVAACRFRRPWTRLDVYVPARIEDQPEDAVEAIKACADDVIELDGEPDATASYLRRNDAMVDGAHRLLAFTDGRDVGGTSYTIDRADDLGLDLRVVPVRGMRDPRRRPNPRVLAEDLGQPAYALEEYRSRDAGGSDLTDFIWDLKDYSTKPVDVQRWAERLSREIASRPDLRVCAALVPMPRRDPALRSDMASLARAVARLTKQDVLEGWLVRTSEPTGGAILGGREHFTADEHAETLAVEGLEAPRGLILLDNVITVGGTMAGAQKAVLRDSGLKALGLALAYSSDLATTP